MLTLVVALSRSYGKANGDRYDMIFYTGSCTLSLVRIYGVHSSLQPCSEQEV